MLARLKWAAQEATEFIFEKDTADVARQCSLNLGGRILLFPLFAVGWVFIFAAAFLFIKRDVE